METSPLTLSRSVLCPLVLLLAACQSGGPGPRAVVVERGAFNTAIQRTDSEQLLLNIVRLRYVDTPQFLELSSIASQVEVEMGGSLSADIPERSRRDLDLGLGASVTVTRAPTVSYTPLQGEEFARQLLTPIDERTLVLLYHSGWSVDRLLRLTMQGLGPLPNAPRASGPTPASQPVFEDFLAVAEDLRLLQIAGRLKLGEGAGQSVGFVQLVIDMDLPREGEPEDPARTVRELLGLPMNERRVVLATHHGSQPGHCSILPRSLMAMLFYASQAVEVPEEDLAAGVATRTLRADGTAFDWNELFGGLFEVHSASQMPEAAYVAVPYRDRWFYIADDDLASKATFSLLDQLFALRAGDRASSAPVLTLPVGS